MRQFIFTILVKYFRITARYIQQLIAVCKHTDEEILKLYIFNEMQPSVYRLRLTEVR